MTDKDKRDTNFLIGLMIVVVLLIWGLGGKG